MLAAVKKNKEDSMEDFNSLPDLLGTAELSKLLKMKSKGYIIRMLRKKGVPIITIGHKKVVVKKSDFQAYIRRMELVGK